MRGDAHVRFGGRAEETGRSKDRNRASVRPYTEHPTREGKVYCAVVLDAFSRRVVGWSISHNPTAALTSNALGMAVEQRDAHRGETVIHSDHGTPSSPPGRSPNEHDSQGSCRRWDRSATASRQPFAATMGPPVAGTRRRSPCSVFFAVRTPTMSQAERSPAYATTAAHRKAGRSVCSAS